MCYCDPPQRPFKRYIHPATEPAQHPVPQPPEEAPPPPPDEEEGIPVDWPIPVEEPADS